MPTIRRLASRLLTEMVRYSSSESQGWGSAMLRELGFVESEWAALLWAFGSTTALCRNLVICQVRTVLYQRLGAAFRLKNMAKKTTGILSGMAVASGVLTLCVLALLGLMSASWWHLGQGPLAERLLVVVVPESIYLVSVATLWRQRKSVLWASC
jgi:hypothetical protein